MRGRASSLLPAGALVTGAGFAVQGLAAYGYLSLASHGLGAARYSALGALWALVFVAAPGLYLPLEQEVGRALAARRVRGVGGRPVVRGALLLGAGMAVAVAGVAVAAHRPLVDRLFDGDGLLLVGFVVAIGCYALYYLGRGTLAGSGRFAAYSQVLVVEGVVRVGAVVALVVVGAGSAGAYSLAIGLPCIAGLLLVLPRQRGLAPPGPPAPLAELSNALGWLLTGSLLSALLVNCGPLAVKAFFSGGDAAAAGLFLNGLIVARIPLFFFQAVQASLLPKLSADAAAGRLDDFRATLVRLLALVGGLVVVAVAGMAVLGPPVVRLIFKSSLGRGDLALLAFGSELFMAALALATACIALGAYARAALGWGAGLAGVALVAAVVPGSVVRVEVAFCAGVVTAVATMGVGLAGALRARAGSTA